MDWVRTGWVPQCHGVQTAACPVVSHCPGEPKDTEDKQERGSGAGESSRQGDLLGTEWWASLGMCEAVVWLHELASRWKRKTYWELGAGSPHMEQSEGSLRGLYGRLG